MLVDISVIQLAFRRALSTLRERWKLLFWPCILFAGLGLVPDAPFGVSFPYTIIAWVVSLFVEVRIIHSLLAGAEGGRKYPVSFLTKVWKYLCYSVIIKGGVVVLGWLSVAGSGALFMFATGQNGFTTESPSGKTLLITLLFPLVVWLATRFLLTLIAVVDGQESPLGLSFRLTKGHFFDLVLTFVFLLGPLGLVLVGLGYGLEFLFPDMQSTLVGDVWEVMLSLLVDGGSLVSLALSVEWYRLLKSTDTLAADEPVAPDAATNLGIKTKKVPIVGLSLLAGGCLVVLAASWLLTSPVLSIHYLKLNKVIELWSVEDIRSE